MISERKRSGPCLIAVWNTESTMRTRCWRFGQKKPSYQNRIFLGVTGRKTSGSTCKTLHIHYLPQKTKGTQKDKTQLNLPILRYPFGKSGYNKKIKQLLKDASIDRKVTEFDEVEGVNKYIPICETSSSKLARSTHVDMMNKV